MATNEYEYRRQGQISADVNTLFSHVARIDVRIGQVELKAERADDKAEQARSLVWATLGFNLIFLLLHGIELSMLLRLAARLGDILP
jgi:hypothetical protein